MTARESTGKRLWAPAFILCAALLSACAAAPSGTDPLGTRMSAVELKELGEKFLGAGDIGQALKYLVMAEEKNPRDPETHYALGLAYDARRLPEEAQAHLLRAVELRSDYSEAWNALGALHARNGRLDEAEAAFRKALANPFYTTPHYAHYNLGQLYEKRGDFNAALAQYDNALHFEPGFARAHLQRGRVLEALGDRAAARRAIGRAIAYDANLAEAHFHYGRLCALMGDSAQAVTALRQVIQLEPGGTLAEAAERYLENLERSRY